MRHLRIIHVLPALRSGGAEQVVRDLARWQTQHGEEVRVVTASSDGDALDHVEHADGLPPHLSSGVRLTWGSYPRAAWWAWQRRESILRADVVHVHLTFGSFFGSVSQAIRHASGSRGPVIVETDHSAGMPISSAQRRFYSLARHGRDAFVSVIRGATSTPTPATALYAEIPNGITPLDVRDSWRQHTPFRLGSLGRLRQDRVPERYLDVLETLRRDREVHLVYGGDGPYRERLESAIAARGLQDCVSLVGKVTDRSAFFTSVDAHLSLASRDDVGLASLEAASSGTPSVALQLDGHYPGRESVIPSAAEAHEVASILLPLIDSADERRSLGLHQATYVRQSRSVNTMANAYMDVYRQALLRSRRTLSG